MSQWPNLNETTQLLMTTTLGYKHRMAQIMAEQIQQHTHPGLLKKHMNLRIFALGGRNVLLAVSKKIGLPWSNASTFLTPNIVVVSLGTHPERVR